MLLDIEGTVGPVSFVRDVLFPYARERMAAFLQAHADDDEVEALVAELRRLHAAETGTGLPPPPWNGDDRSAAAAYAGWLIDRDRKATPLKDLQGRVWEDGYASGALEAPLFDDVAPALRRWHEDGIGLAIYSSGSVLAQKLYFGHTSEGDLAPLIGAWFDTATGPKTDARSYARIAQVLNVRNDSVLFVSDATAEVAAAAGAGMRAVLRVAAGATPAGPHEAASFMELRWTT